MLRSRLTQLIAAGALLASLGLAACGSSSGGSTGSTGAGQAAAPEVNPAGDIPDNQAFVAYTAPGTHASVKVPEGWSRTASAGAVTFTDKLNAIRIEGAPASGPLSASAARRDLAALRSRVAGFAPGTVTTVSRAAGPAVRMTYLARAQPNAVTGRAGQDAVERYVFFHQGRRLVLTLSGPKGADNVDPWKIVTDSVRWSA
jgi:hypothetical protein